VLATPLVTPSRAVSTVVDVRGRARTGRLCWASRDMARDPREERDVGGGVVVEKERKTAQPRKYSVVFHNDDYTTREFVVHVLMRFFEKSETEATHIMLTVHHKGRGVAGVYSRDLAETKAQQVMDYATRYQMPLRVTAEPCD
jgi:ATP-dependent Clp protease adaptor protein ClpS